MRSILIIVWTNLNASLPQIILCFLFMLNFSLLKRSWVVLKDKLREIYYPAFQIGKKKNLNLIHLWIKQLASTFNGVLHSITAGLGMISPLSPLLCNIFMTYFKAKLYSTH